MVIKIDRDVGSLLTCVLSNWVFWPSFRRTTDVQVDAPDNMQNLRQMKSNPASTSLTHNGSGT
jgi:hypothetical protein